MSLPVNFELCQPDLRRKEHESESGNNYFEGVMYYLDGEGRLCAVKNSYTPFAMTGYLYDGNGDRIAKGTLTSFSCNLASNGFALTSSYVVDKDGQQLTELQGGTPVHTNVFANGGLLATYASSQTFFSFKDWLGTKRVEIGVTCKSTYASLPYGDELTPNGNCPDATEHHYTGKEHDTESGNDFLLARYYSSNTGRFMSPDWASDPTAVPYAAYADPQSLNLYGYVRGNPLTGFDANGHGWIDVPALIEKVSSWLSTSHSGSMAKSGSVSESTERTGPLSVTAKAFTAKAEASASYGTKTGVSGQVSGSVASVTTKEGSRSTTQVDALTAHAGANASVGSAGVSAGAGAHADVLSASQSETFSLGPVTLTATISGEVGVGADASFSASPNGVTEAAGAAFGYGGQYSFSANWNSLTGTTGGSVNGNSDQTTTTFRKPEIQ